MNLLLDTHVLIWLLSATLSVETEKELLAEANCVYVSAVSAWEIAIKRAMAKLDFEGDYQEGMEHHALLDLPILTKHCLEVEFLPLHHKDPFDRLLITQAQIEDLTLVTHDHKIGYYDVKTWMI